MGPRPGLVISTDSTVVDYTIDATEAAANADDATVATEATADADDTTVHVSPPPCITRLLATDAKRTTPTPDDTLTPTPSRKMALRSSVHAGNTSISIYQNWINDHLVEKGVTVIYI